MSHLRSAGGQGENHQLPAALGWGSAEKGLSLPVPLSFLSVFLKCLDAVTNLNPSLTEKCSKFSNILHCKPPGTASCLLVAALKHKHTETHTHMNAKCPFNPSAPAEEWQSSRAHGNMELPAPQVLQVKHTEAF